MSSAMKDARWRIAMKTAEDLGVDWDSLTYPEQSRLLYSAQQFLDLAKPAAIEEQAKKWNNNE